MNTMLRVGEASGDGPSTASHSTSSTVSPCGRSGVSNASVRAVRSPERNAATLNTVVAFGDFAGSRASLVLRGGPDVWVAARDDGSRGAGEAPQPVANAASHAASTRVVRPTSARCCCVRTFMDLGLEGEPHLRTTASLRASETSADGRSARSRTTTRRTSRRSRPQRRTGDECARCAEGALIDAKKKRR